MEKNQWYIGAPNGVVLCVNRDLGGQLQGKLYHSYSTEASPFSSIKEMTEIMEALYDSLNFPHPGNNERVFVPVEKTTQIVKEKERVMSDENMLSKHGDLGTFIVRVQHRQNSSWQGRLTWMEQDKTLNFRSVWEMIKLIENAVDTVSEPEDEVEINWFQDKE